VRTKYHLISLHQAIQALHLPQSRDVLEQANRRFTFDRILKYLLQVEVQKSKCHRSEGIAFKTNGLFHAFCQMLPFEPTEAQCRVMQEIAHDMSSQQTMNRLVQGDVGSGKTAVAAFSLYVAVQNGYQGVMLAPTELLATQHFKTLQAIFGDSVCLLNGGMPARERRETLRFLRDGVFQIAVGTHALFEDDVILPKLGLVVTDEQHRFGVSQRAIIAAKADHPDILVMSATPIPRTLALLMYGDLDISVIDQLPLGRKPIKTSLIPDHKRTAMYNYIREQAKADIRTYIVCPYIDDSDEVGTLSAVSLYQELCSELRDVPIGLLHGKMSAEEKQKTIDAFRSGSTKILVSTTVIEVGVDVPEACIMVIEGAEHFGLAQLHQLRGRVGRGQRQSYCFLLSENCSESVLQRLHILSETTDGFLIAEKDLELRGPGDICGVRQHGVSMLDDLGSPEIVENAREAALKLLTSNDAKHSSFLQSIKCDQTARIAMN